MRFTIGVSDYDIRFSYKTLENGTVETTATISFIDPHIASGRERFKPLYSGNAQQSVRDTFKKDTGRKVALARALAHLPRASRKIAWEAYHSRK